MKQIFYKGLLALTIAFGVTSCDKNEMDDIAAPTVGVVENGDYSKVSFGEATGIIAPKSKGSASKNAAEFADLHVFATTDQILTISKDGEAVYTGSYTAGDISDLDPSSIILSNGSYTAVSSNEANAGLGLVSGFAPYTSSKDFSLDESGSIQLDVAHERGFVIADSERADGGSRILSVTLSQAAGDGSVVSGNLISDGSDENDFYGYLVAGMYNVSIAYTRGSESGLATGEIEIIQGVAVTLEPILLGDVVPEPVLSTSSDVSSETFVESEIPADSPAPAFSNLDNDLLDTVSRVVTSTFTTTDGTRDAGQTPSVVYGEWMVIATSNDLGVDESPNPGDGSVEEDLTAPVITLASDLPADGGLIATDYTFTITSDDADAVIVWSKNGSVVSGESGLTYTTSFGNANGDKVISVSVTDAADNAASESLTFTVSEPVVEEPTDTASDTISYDGVFSEDADSRDAGLITGTVWVFGGVDHATLALAQAAADLTGTSLDVVIVERASYADDTFTQTQGFSVVVQGGIADVPAPEADAAILTQAGSEANADVDVDVDYTTTAAPIAATWGADADGVYTNSDFVGYSFTVSGGILGSSARITSPDGSVEATTPIGQDFDLSASVAAAIARIAVLVG